MSKLFIFSIGGSGSRVIRSLSMLLASGVPHFKSGDQVFPIMIDYDVDNGDTKRAYECVEIYNNLHASAYPIDLEKKQKTDRRFFHTSLMKMADMGGELTSSFTMQFRHNPNDKTFGDAIAYDSLRGEKSKTKDLLKTLYDVSSSDDTELGIDMTVGFKGNPNIGSVVFNNLKGTNELKDFFKCCQPENGDKVILIGSLFGGTGASGIPELVKAIRNERKTANVQLGVIMLMPYFSFDPSDEKGTVKSNLFDSKTRAALSFYESSEVNNKIDSIYYIGDKERTKTPYHLGGKLQRNKSHIVDLIGAISVLHFFNTDKSGGRKKYKYRIRDNEKNHEPGYTILNFYKDDYQNIIHSMVKLAFAVKFVESEIAKKTKEVTDRPYSKAFELPLYYDDKGRVNEPNRIGDTNNNPKYEPGLHSTLYNFQRFSDLFVEWVKEMKETGNHKLVMFDFDRSIEWLVQDCKLSEIKSGWGGSSKEIVLVNPMDFSEQIQKYYSRTYQDAAPVKGELHFKDTTAGYAMLDCLLNGIENVITIDKIKSILKLK